MIYIKDYLRKRIIGVIPVLLVISFISFGLMYLSPSDPAEMMLTSQGSVVTPELLISKRIEMGLDKPFLMQYFNWLQNIFKGDMGISYSTGRKVIIELKEHLPYTVMLAFSSMITTLIVSIPLGILCAVKKNKFTDYIIRGISFIGISIPNFFIGLILLLIFSFKLKIFPILSESGIKSMILPALTLAIPMTSKYVSQIRSVVLDELDKNYVKGLRSRGIKEKQILYINVLKNVMVTIVTLSGMSLGSLMGGTAVVETIFVWPGLGSLLLSAISNRDYILIQGYVLWMGVIFIIINLITDLLYILLDPRMRTEK